MKILIFLFVVITPAFAQFDSARWAIERDSAWYKEGDTYQPFWDTSTSFERDSLIRVRWDDYLTCEDIHYLHTATDSLCHVWKDRVIWLDKMDSIARSYEQQFREQHNPKSAKPKKDGSGELYEPPRRRRKEIASEIGRSAMM